MTRRSAINTCCGLIFALLLSSVCGFAPEVRGASVGSAGDVPGNQGLRRMPQGREHSDLSTVGQQQALSGQRRLLRMPHGSGRRTGCVQARGRLDRDDRVAQGLHAVPCPGRGRVRPVAPLEGRPHPRLPGQHPGRGDRRQPGHGDSGLPEGRQLRGGQRLLAMPRQRGQGPARRQARPGHLAQYGDRPNQPRRLRRLLLRVPQPALVLGLRRPGTPTTAASATWGRTIRRWRSTTNRNTASPSARSTTS